MKENHQNLPATTAPINGATERQPVVLNEAQMNLMNKKTPTDAIRKRKVRGGRQVNYVTHAWVTGQLNEAFGWNWDFRILDTRVVPETEPVEVVVLGQITVRTKLGTIIKEQFGTASVKRFSGGENAGQIISLGDDLKAAGSDALKKCSSLIGIALDLYES